VLTVAGVGIRRGRIIGLLLGAGNNKFIQTLNLI
jgi:hypothetical protein